MIGIGTPKSNNSIPLPIIRSHSEMFDVQSKRLDALIVPHLRVSCTESILPPHSGNFAGWGRQVASAVCKNSINPRSAELSHLVARGALVTAGTVPALIAAITAGCT